MHRQRWKICGLIASVSAFLLCGGGCAWHRTCQGWIIRSGWSLEFKRNQSSCCNLPGCLEGCDDSECNCASTTDCESDVLYEANPKLLEKLSTSPFARLLERRGRLGICASCGRLGRFQESGAGKTASEPVIAKLHPLPTQPVFCPRIDTVQPTSFDTNSPEKKASSLAPPKRSSPKEPPPELIPPPPPTLKGEKSAAVPRKMEVAPEPSSWLFSSASDKKPDPVIEAQLPPRPSEPATKR
jgi:hypothetical protein